MSKKIIVIMLVGIMVLGGVSAKTLKDGETETDYSLDLSFVYNAVNLIVGVFAGGYVLLKAAMDIFHAVRNSSEDPNGLKKAIGNLVLNIAILASFLFVINYVFGSLSADNVNLEDATAQEAFFAALTGAMVRSGL